MNDSSVPVDRMPLPRGFGISQLSVAILNDNDGHIELEICDEGGGAFIAMKIDGVIRLDPGELGLLDRFASALCDWMDRSIRESGE